MSGDGDVGGDGGVYIDETGMEHQAYLKMDNVVDDVERNEVADDDVVADAGAVIKNEDLQSCWRVLLDLIGYEGAPRNKWIEVADLAADEKT